MSSTETQSPRPVPGILDRWVSGRRAWIGLALIGALVLAGNGLGVVVSHRVLSRPPATTSGPLKVTFRIPSGFVEDDHDYSLLVPLYKHVTTRWVRPTDEPVGLDVIFVNSYVTGQDEHGSPARIRQRIASYDHRVAAVHATTPVQTRVDHRQAWTQYVVQPLLNTTEVAVYSSTYLFIDQDLVQIGCQWDQNRTEVMTGCGEVLQTLRITR